MTTTTWPQCRTDDELVADARLIERIGAMDAVRSAINDEIRSRAKDRIPGSGQITCPCQAHKDRCMFGRPHVWATWYENGKLVRTSETYHCWTCDAVCTADED